VTFPRAWAAPSLVSSRQPTGVVLAGRSGNGGVRAESVARAAPPSSCGASPWSGWVATSRPRTTSPAAPRRARPRPRSCAASSATSPARSSPPAHSRAWRTLRAPGTGEERLL